jgi:hypothetical protein
VVSGRVESSTGLRTSRLAPTRAVVSGAVSASIRISGQRAHPASGNWSGVITSSGWSGGVSACTVAARSALRVTSRAGLPVGARVGVGWVVVIAVFLIDGGRVPHPLSGQGWGLSGSRCAGGVIQGHVPVLRG